MSHIEDLSIATQIRIPTIKCGKLRGLTQTKLAEECNVSRRTIYRDIIAWTNTDDFIKWAREIFVNKIGKVEDKDALKAATSIIVKDMTTKAEIKTELTKRLEVKLIDSLNPDEKRLLESAARKYIKTRNTAESASIH